MVPNDSLMDAHQSELAHELVCADLATVTDPVGLADRLRDLDLKTPPQILANSTSSRPHISLGDILNQEMGFASSRSLHAGS